MRKSKYHFKNFTPEEWSEHQKKTHSTDEFKEKQSKALKAAHRDPKLRKKLLDANLKGNKTRKETMKAQWKDPHLRDKRVRGIRRSRRKYGRGPNKLEKKIQKLIDELGYAYEFTGASAGCTVGGAYTPDFKHRTQKKIIEAYGRYWHDTQEAKVRDKLRLECYKNYSYRVLIIWDDEVNSIEKMEKTKNRIRRFHNRR